jgi:hypothetical protein
VLTNVTRRSGWLYLATDVSKKAAKRRRREQERKKRTGTRRGGLVMALAPPGTESPGDKIARETRSDDSDDGGAPVREPRRPRPRDPLSGAVALEMPTELAPVDAVTGGDLDDAASEA